MSDTEGNAKLDPARTALLVMDFQPGIIGRLDDSDALVARAGEAIAAARAAGATVGYVRVAFTDEDFDALPDEAPMARVKAMPRERLHADSPETQVDERVAPAEGDIVVRKTRVGPFLTTDFHQALIEKVLPRQAEVIEVADLAGLLG